MNSLYDLYNRLNEMTETGCTKTEAEEFFAFAKSCLKEYVSDHIENFFEKTKDDFEEAVTSGDADESTEKLEMVADVIDEFLRNAEEEEMQGIPYIVYHMPRNTTDAEIIADHICDVFTVIVNCSELDVFEFEKVYNFIAGAAYANGARIVFSKPRTFFVVPYHIEVPDEEVFDYIEKNGVAVNFIDKESTEREEF
jgi:FtsZ-interacting cell division protein YlmF